MTNYYYLATVLPKLTLGEKPEISFHEFITLLQDNLTPSDYDKTRRLRWFYDLLNIRAYWKGDPLDYWGNLDEVQLEDAVLVREGGELPNYFYEYLDEYEHKEDRQKHFQQVISDYFRSEAINNTGFLKKLRSFERNLRLVMTAFRARQLGRNLAAELQFEDPEEDIIAQLLAQSDAKVFEPPQGFEDFKSILERNYDNPLQLQKAIIEYIFNWIEDELEFDYFSIDRILGYMAQFILVERLMRLDKEKGLKVLDNIVKEIS
jgi:Protein of unknown function (DUF2764)